MSDAHMSIRPTANLVERHFFGLPLTAEERVRRGILRAVCLRAVFLSLLVYCVYTSAMVLTTCVPLLANQWENTFPEAPQTYAAIRTTLTGRGYYPFTQGP